MAKPDAEKRRERLAAALRENLKRRKAHTRKEAMAAKTAAETPSPTSAEDLSPPKSPR